MTRDKSLSIKRLKLVSEIFHYFLVNFHDYEISLIYVFIILLSVNEQLIFIYQQLMLKKQSLYNASNSNQTVSDI